MTGDQIYIEDVVDQVIVEEDGTVVVTSPDAYLGLDDNVRFINIPAKFFSGSESEPIVIPIEFDCQIIGWKIIADEDCSVEFDIFKSNFEDYPTMSSIVGSNPPVLEDALKSESEESLTGWTTTILHGDMLKFTITDSSDLNEWVTLSLECRKI